MRIIDINAAVGASHTKDRFEDAEGLLRHLDTYRIDKALVYHRESYRVPEKGNAAIVELARQHPDRIGACLWLEPALETLGLPGEGSVADRLRALKPAILRVKQGDERHFLMDRFYARDMLDLLAPLHVPLIVEAGYTRIFFHALPEMAMAYPSLSFILLQHGFNESRMVNPLLKHTTNVYFDISIMLDCGQLEEITERFGSQRLLIGSGLPTSVPTGGLGLLHYAQISQEDKENIAFRNAERLIGGIQYDA